MSSAAAVDPAAGLTTREALETLERVGRNVLPEPTRPPTWRRLAAQFAHFFALLLWGAAGLALIGGMPALADCRNLAWYKKLVGSLLRIVAPLM